MVLIYERLNVNLWVGRTWQLGNLHHSTFLQKWAIFHSNRSLQLIGRYILNELRSSRRSIHLNIFRRVIDLIAVALALHTPHDLNILANCGGIDDLPLPDDLAASQRHEPSLDGDIKTNWRFRDARRRGCILPIQQFSIDQLGP